MITLGTLLSTLFRGELVGIDEFGNRYYRGRGRGLRRYGRERRWVLYKGKDEASKVPAEWHAWLHQTVPVPLTESAALSRDWQKPHRANPTGTPEAYHPRRHRGGRPAAGNGEAYQAWTPEGEVAAAARPDAGTQ